MRGLCHGRYLFLLLDNVGCRRSFFAFDNVKGNPGTFLQRLEALSLDCAVVNKNILATVLFDKPKTLRIIKPFYCSFCHFKLLLTVRGSTQEPLNNKMPVYENINRLAAIVFKQKNRTPSF